MELLLTNADVLNIILELSNNYSLYLLSKSFYNVILNGGQVCPTCNKIVKIFNKIIWINDDHYCHSFRGEKNEYDKIINILNVKPEFIKVVERQCFTFCRIAVSRDLTLIQYVKNQSYLLSVINDDITNIKFIKNPSFLLCQQAINKDPFLIKYINQTEDLCWQALKLDTDVFRDINHQTIEMCQYVLKKSLLYFDYIKYKKEEHYLMLYDLNPDVFYNKLNPKQCKTTAFGYGALSSATSNNNTAIGYDAGVNLINGDHNIYINNEGKHNDNHVIRIGTNQTTNIQAGIYNNKIGNGRPVFVTSNGELGVL